LLTTPFVHAQLPQPPPALVAVHVTFALPIVDDPLTRSPYARDVVDHVSFFVAPATITTTWTDAFAGTLGVEVGLASGNRIVDGVTVNVSVSAAFTEASLARRRPAATIPLAAHRVGLATRLDAEIIATRTDTRHTPARYGADSV
jgi:hypothetical protein